ncbi:thiamine ABC transporter ATP-binding protein [Vibrio sp. SCSIO 43136]|uniref:thiamine ABC transporter ATP-binding protein n=1 Tax=Vibrio sp. SCSIO 43136 TaxID=2819101 RepID=UPI002075A2F2|nr:thiamine ABC transporter ATP-binding protein [Vibrio sp. SCSIO 43136]USD66717.1 thiamine ABC transporter ATP-binding protein [Vibrio sp. SCSIO 43136]
MTTPKLALNQVKYRYHNETFDFDLQVKSGNVLALMGPSGAGKSTLLALVAGFIEPELGEITANGQRVNGLAPHQRPVAMLFQEHNLFAHLSIKENIALGIHPGLNLSDKQWLQVETAAKQVGIDALLERLPEQVSGGQKQRAALARCLVQPFDILLLDEPFSALDPVIREEMLNLVKHLAKEQNLTVVMVTHHVSDAQAIASHFAYMQDGQVEEVGEIEALRSNHTNPNLAAFVKAGE